MSADPVTINDVSATFNAAEPRTQVAVYENGEVQNVTVEDDGFVVVTGPGLFESGRQEFPTTGTVQITFKPVPVQ